MQGTRFELSFTGKITMFSTVRQNPEFYIGLFNYFSDFLNNDTKFPKENQLRLELLIL